MKRERLISALVKAGFVLVGGTRHDKFRKDSVTVMVPRHTEINEMLARKILKDAGITQ